MFHRRHETDTFDPDDALPKPCPQMKGLLSALADGTLTGIPRWYAEHHVKGCPHCTKTLASLHVLRDRVRALGVPVLEESAGEAAASRVTAIPAERRVSLESALADAESRMP